MRARYNDLTKCLKCIKPEKDCKCKGGYKICYYKGEPLSKEELDAIPKPRSISEIKKDFAAIRKLLG